VTTRDSVFAAREHLLSEGSIPDHLVGAVRPAVLQSWQRSLRSGANPNNPTLVFRGEQTARTVLRVAADPVLSRLADQLSGLQAGVLLSDHEANIVRRWAPDTTIRPMMDRIHSDVGFCVSEETIGTNGIGSVIEQGSAIQICGPEHLAQALTSFTCVGVPIHNPITRRLEGVITMNCQATAGNPLLTPLMTSTAHEVESRMLAQATATERQLLDEYLMAIGSRRAPVAAIGQDICIAGPRVTELLEGVDRAMLWEHVRAVALGSSSGVKQVFATDRFRIARCQLVESDGRVLGALVEFEVAREQKVEEQVVPAPAAARPTVRLPGRSAALAQSIAQATRLAAKRVPIVIEGESGVGKFALAQELLGGASVTSDKIAVIDAAVGRAEGATEFVGVLRQELEREPDALLLRHLECLTPEAAAATASILEDRQAAGTLPRFVATLTIGPQESGAGLRRLIDTVGVGRVSLAPLRDRRDDIAPMAVELLRKHSDGRKLYFSSAALRCLMRAPWPGNLRQLDAMIRAVVSTAMGSEIRPEALPPELQGNSRRRELSAMEELELGAILEALQRHGGNKVAAAHSIGISRSTLYRKLQAYHIDPDKQYF
jgi:transcriptional regulator of acetoin/glycerol metabolism